MSVIRFPKPLNPLATDDQVEEFYFDLFDVGLVPCVLISNNSVMSLTFEIEDKAHENACEAMGIMKRASALFSNNVDFRERFFKIVLSYGGVLQEFGCPRPMINVRRTLFDVRRELGIAEIN